MIYLLPTQTSTVNDFVLKQKKERLSDKKRKSKKNSWIYKGTTEIESRNIIKVLNCMYILFLEIYYTNGKRMMEMSPKISHIERDNT